MPERRFLKRTSTIVLLVLAFAAAGTGWGAATYVRLVRLQIRVQDECSRVETASRVRLELVANLLHQSHGLGGFPDSVRDQVERASVDVAQFAMVPRPLRDPSAYQRYRQAQGELSSALQLSWVEGRVSSALRSRLERAAARVDGRLGAMELGVRTYREAVVSFPGSLVATLAGFDRNRPRTKRS